MNNSIERLIDGMVATLRKDIIAHIEGDYARGQAFGVVYMLESLKRRASWSSGFLVEQLRALEDASRALQALAPNLAGAPLPETRAPDNLPDAAALQALRDEGDARLCALIDWLATNRAALKPDVAQRAQAIVDAYLERQLKFEISTSAKPMFVEMSGGSEKT